MNPELKDLSPYERYSKVGAPAFWTDERIDALIKRMNDWANKDSSITMTEWRAEEELTLQQIRWLKEKSKQFTAGYELAKARIAARITKKTGRGVHQAHYNRYIPLYDEEVQEFDMAMASIKSAAAAQVRAEEVQKGVSIIDRFESVAKKDS